MNINQPSIWHTVEIDCICRSLDYDMYKQVHYDINCKGALVTPEMYAELSTAFFNAMEQDFLKRGLHIKR